MGRNLEKETEPVATAPVRSDFVYDQDGKLLYSQNDLQRATGKFSYIVYDKYNRPIESGEYDPTLSSSQGQPFYFHTHEDFVTNGYINVPTNSASFFAIPLHLGHTVASIDPQRCTIRAFTQYDLHDFAILSGLNIPQANTYRQRYLMGQVSKTWDDQGNTTWYSYDELGRTTWMVQKLAGLAPKTSHYHYDFQGNLLQMDFQRDTREAFHHKYVYDEDNRLTRSYISIDGRTWDEQSEYKYYKHGPLKRLEVDKDLQGIDYVYTIDGKLKQVNHPATELNGCAIGATDPGGDGNTGSKFAGDVFGFSLDYHALDYRRGHNMTHNIPSTKDRYDGMIKGMRWSTMSRPYGNQGQLAYTYDYNRLGQMQEAEFGGFCGGSFTISQAYKVSGLTYDKNGNLLTLNRNADISTAPNAHEIDRLTYHYQNGSNMLDHVDDIGAADGQFEDISDQAAGNYTYDALGQLIIDKQGKIKVEYTPSGLVKLVRYFNFSDPNDVQNDQIIVSFEYNERNHRISKSNYGHEGQLSSTTHYVRDAAGLLLSIYKTEYPISGTPTTRQVELPIYGTGRVAMYYRGDPIQGTSDQKYYQLTDHLGNVRAVISRVGNTPVVVTARDYYPFGWPLPGRSLEGTEQYRYAYQGQERDPETEWEAFELRMWDGRLGRWMSIDPARQYASPYVGMGNNPVVKVDPDGGLDTEYINIQTRESVTIDDGVDKTIYLDNADFETALMFSIVIASEIVTFRDGWQYSTLSEEFAEAYYGFYNKHNNYDGLTFEGAVDLVFGTNFTGNRPYLATRGPEVKGASPFEFFGGPGKMVLKEAIKQGSKGALVGSTSRFLAIGRAKLLPYLTQKGKLHGKLPHSGEFINYSNDQLLTLLDDLHSSVGVRLKQMIKLGNKGNHGSRLRAEEDLIKSLKDYLKL